MREYKVIILTAPSGHLTQAKAVHSYLADIPRVNVKILDMVGNLKIWDTFRTVYRYFPFLMKIPFELTKNPEILEIVKNSNTRRLKDQLTRVIELESPDLVISTHYGYIAPLDELKAKYHFKYINSITDPVEVHPLLFSHEADYNIGFNEACCEAGRQLGIPSEKIAPVGWFTERSFFQDYPIEKIRQSLGLEPERTLMICAGSEGTNAILALLPAILFSTHRTHFQVIFITGHNQGLAHFIEKTSHLAPLLNPYMPKIQVVEFTDRMHEYMAVSDVIIGKAGPNLIFESVASRKPFIAITHISGNEDGNLQMIKEHDLGWVAENPISASKLIDRIIENPEMLQKKVRALDQAARKCLGAGLFLRARVLEWNDAARQPAGSRSLPS
jgi:processive 1,2-diacylglycerol beta-glucosyltransferase